MRPGETWAALFLRVGLCDMKRRMRLLTDGQTQQENWALWLVERFGRTHWDVSIAAPDTRPLIGCPGPDVLWVIDPVQASRIADGRFRFLVYDKTVKAESHAQMAGALILKMCADAVYSPFVTSDPLSRVPHDCYNELDRQIRDELFEEIKLSL